MKDCSVVGVGRLDLAGVLGAVQLVEVMRALGTLAGSRHIDDVGRHAPGLRGALDRFLGEHREGDEHLRVGVFEVEGDLGGPQERVERAHDQACLEDAEVREEELREVGQLNRDYLSPRSSPRSSRLVAMRPEISSTWAYVKVRSPKWHSGLSGCDFRDSRSMVARLKLMRLLLRMESLHPPMSEQPHPVCKESRCSRDATLREHGRWRAHTSRRERDALDHLVAAVQEHAPRPPRPRGVPRAHLGAADHRLEGWARFADLGPSRLFHAAVTAKVGTVPERHQPGTVLGDE